MYSRRVLQRQHYVAELYAHGLPNHQIAALFGLSMEQIRRDLRATGQKPRGQWGAPKRARKGLNRRFSEILSVRVPIQLAEDLKKIADRDKCTMTQIARRLIKQGLADELGTQSGTKG